MENINNENDQDNNNEFIDQDDSENVDGLDDTETIQDSAIDETIIDETNVGFASSDHAYEAPSFAVGAEPPPPFPPYVGAQVEDRLVRDPHASFGGVLSGIANRYGWETSLVRLAFVVAVLVTGGAAILAYFLAWIIIPRARFWPPAVRKRTRSLSGRDLGLALIGVALLIVISIGAGEAASIIVPLVLVAGGVWMLLQSPRDAVAVAGVDAPAAPSNYAFTPTQQPSAGPGSGPWTAPQMPTITPQPVQPRGRGRKFVIAGLILAVVLIPVLIVGGIIAAVAFGDLDIDVTEQVTPGSVESIPTSIDGVEGEYILDLRNVDFSDVDSSDPVEVSISQEFGRIEVRLPSEVAVEVLAEADLGELEVLGQNEQGITEGISILNDDAQLVLDLDVEVGDIEVTQG